MYVERNASNEIRSARRSPLMSARANASGLLIPASQRLQLKVPLPLEVPTMKLPPSSQATMSARPSPLTSPAAMRRGVAIPTRLVVAHWKLEPVDSPYMYVERNASNEIKSARGAQFLLV